MSLHVLIFSALHAYACTCSKASVHVVVMTYNIHEHACTCIVHVYVVPLVLLCGGVPYRPLYMYMYVTHVCTSVIKLQLVSYIVPTNAF